MNPEQLNFDAVPKILFDGSVVGVGRHFLPLAMRTGPQVQVYAIVPEDMKNLHAIIGNALKLYEDMYGPIPDSKAPIPSPINLSDLPPRS